MTSRLLATLIVVANSSFAALSAEPGKNSRDESATTTAAVVGEPIAAGFLIVDGEYVSPPYIVSYSESELRINGYPVSAARNHLSGVQEWAEDSDSRAATRRPEHQVARLERRLAHGELLLRSADGRVAEFFDEGVIDVLRLAMSKQPRSERLVELLRFSGNDFGSNDWGRLLDRFQPTDELLTRIASLRVRLDQQMEGVEVVHRGMTRSYSYALTVIGMLLVVVAFGTVLTFRPVGDQSWRTEDRSASSVRLVVRCVLLMCVLSVFDLACTYLARSADQFSELNPLAETLLDAPAVLVSFKIALTGLAALILWRLRFYRGTQVASWWLCLLLTLLAVRWVAVESLLMA